MISEFLQSKRSITWMVSGIIIGITMFAGSLAFLMVPNSEVIEENNGGDLTCLHIPFTDARAREIIGTYNPDALEAARKLHLPGDILFPFGYGLLYASLLGLVVRDQEGPWLKALTPAIFFPLFAMVFDWVENFYILKMLTHYTIDDADPSALPLWGSIFGATKYLLLSILTPLAGTVGTVNAHKRGKLKGWKIVLYVFIMSMLVFNVWQLITSVIPCFSS